MDNPKNQDFVKCYKWSFDDIIASGVDPNLASVIMLGAGASINQTAGSLVINAGTTAFSEVVLRLLPDAVEFDGILRYGLTLSQRLSANNFIIELVDLIGDRIPFTALSAVSVQCNLPMHGFTAKDIGKTLTIGALTLASCPTQRATIATIIDENNFTLTVAGFPVSGGGTCSLFGLNNHMIVYNGASQTALGGGYSSSRNGWNNTPVNAVINSTFTGHIGVLECVRHSDSTYSDAPFGSSTFQQFIPRAVMNQNVPDPGYPMVIQIRSANTASAPGTNTVCTIGFVDMELFTAIPMRMSAVDPVSSKSAVSTAVVSSNGVTSLFVQGAAGRNTISPGSGNPLYIATGKNVNPSPLSGDGRSVDLFADMVGRLTMQLGGIPQTQDPNRVVLAAATETTLIAAVASIRHGIHAIEIANRDAVAHTLDLRDTTAGVIRKTYIVPAGQTLAIPYDCGIWQAAVNTNWTVQLRAVPTTAVEVSATSYRVPY